MISDERLEDIANDRALGFDLSERVAMAKELLSRRNAEDEPVGFIESKVGSERYIFRCYSGYVINCHDNLYRKPFSD